MRRSHTFSIPIAGRLPPIYRFLADPRNYPSWSAMEEGGYHQLDNGDWAGHTAFGFRHVRFTPPNSFGVLDHALFEPGGEILFSPMRVVANGAATELIFTFFQRADMDEAQFASTLEWIRVDLLSLASVVEVLQGS